VPGGAPATPLAPPRPLDPPAPVSVSLPPQPTSAVSTRIAQPLMNRTPEKLEAELEADLEAKLTDISTSPTTVTNRSIRSRVLSRVHGAQRT
jgi:hypothetical protein